MVLPQDRLPLNESFDFFQGNVATRKRMNMAEYGTNTASESKPMKATFYINYRVNLHLTW